MSRRVPQMLAVAVALGIGLVVVLRVPRPGNARESPVTFTQVGESGPVFTVSVPRGRADDDQYLMQVAEQLSATRVREGGSGQISVMVWPDDVAVPKEPPTTEFDASMTTQVAGIFINPGRHIKHLIRFRHGATVAERDFGAPTR